MRRLQDAGAKNSHFAQHCFGRETKHTRIPPIFACRKIVLGSFKVRLLYKAFDVVANGLDIAKPSVRLFRFDAEGHNATLLGQCHGLRHGYCESGLVGNQVIRGEHQEHHIVTVGTLFLQGGHGDRRRCVAAQRFQQKTGHDALRRVDLSIIVFSFEEQLAVGDSENFFDARQCSAANKSFLQQALAIGQTHERLGMQLTRHRPQPGASAAAENDWNKHKYPYQKIVNSNAMDG